jgi:hypothetical protein
VTQPLDTVLIEISARASTPRAAQALADAWVQALKSQVDSVENPTGAADEDGRKVDHAANLAAALSLRDRKDSSTAYYDAYYGRAVRPSRLRPRPPAG